MVIRLGNQEPNNLYVGNQPVQKVYRGNVEVWARTTTTNTGTGLVIERAIRSGSNLDLDIRSDYLGTLYYGFYPAGTSESDVSVAGLVAGTDSGLVTSGRAGVFVALGELADTAISTSALSSGVSYVLVFVVDINDAGDYSNLALETF